MNKFLVALLTIAVVGTASCGGGSQPTRTPTPTATPRPLATSTPTPAAGATAAGTPAPTPVGGIVFGTFEKATVSIQNLAFQPENVEIMNGGLTVTWTNRDSVPHTVTGPGFDSGPLAPGATFTRTFTAGNIDYWCTLHPTMKGMVGVMVH